MTNFDTTVSQHDQEKRTKAWLVRTSGSLAGTRYRVTDTITRVGRSLDNDVVLEDDASVSGVHFQIECDQDAGVYRLRDLGSRNGTFVNGERVEACEMEAPASIQMGASGPRLTFLFDDMALPRHQETQVITEIPAELRVPNQERLAAEAAARIRLARMRDVSHDQTHNLLRDAIARGMGETRRRLRGVIAVLAIALGVVAAGSFLQVRRLQQEKAHIDTRIQEVEKRLAEAQGDEQQTEELIARLESYQGEARDLSNGLFFRLGAVRPEPTRPAEAELKALMQEFGAETYTFPPDFLEQVERFVKEYQGPNRPLIVSALGEARRDVQIMRQIFVDHKLPPDLAYMAVVESAITKVVNRQSGAAGPWQLMAPTARAFGLTVNANVDERMNVRKSTVAACKIMRELILDFGAGGSVMLAVAAYNGGPGKVKQAVRSAVKDPIRQRNFWYLYRVRALPKETMEYVPKVLAVLIISRNPRLFGFT